MSIIKILQVVDSLDAGGMEAQLVSLMGRLDPARFEFKVVCLRHAGVHAARLPDRIPVIALGKQEGFQFSVVRDLRSMLREGFDLVHTHNWAPLVYASLATLGGRTTPVFHGEHSQLNAAELSPRRLAARRWLYRCCSAVHTVSAEQKEKLLQAGLKHPRLHSLVNGVNTARFTMAEDQAATRRMLGLPEQARILGVVARFGAFKRHAALVRAFESIAQANPDVLLVMVGDGGPEKEKIVQQVKLSPARDQIMLAGFQEDPVPWYQSMDALLVPSSNEGLSNATLEAMACGVPVLSNNICGARELIGEDEGGWVRDLSTHESLLDELVALLRLPRTDWQRAGARGRARALSLFSWEAMAGAYAGIFAECAQPSRS
jgi:glycosyltransferase involved in cell wall biosynthesis